MSNKRFRLTNPKNAFQEMKCGINDGNKTLTFNEVVDVLNILHEENKQLKGSLYAEKINTAEVINDYSKQFKRHSKEFSFMIDLAEDLGVDVSKLEAKDD